MAKKLKQTTKKRFSPENSVLHLGMQDSSNSIMSKKNKNYTLLSEWFIQIIEILLGINANGRLPTGTPQKRIMHISGRWKKALTSTFFYYRDNVIKEFHNLVVCIFLSCLKEINYYVQN